MQDGRITFTNAKPQRHVHHRAVGRGVPPSRENKRAFRRTGAPDIAIVNFGVHPDTIGGTKYSADWPGVVRWNRPTADEIKWVEMFDAGRKDEIPLGSMEIKTLASPWSRVRRLKNGPDHFDVLVTSLAIGDNLAFAGLPCEPFVDIGRAVKARSPFRMTVFTCLTNGSEGYIASTKAHAEGGYEALSSRFAAPTGDRLVKAQLDQLTTLKNASRKKLRQP